jgi:hypothetical protein
MGLFLFIFVLPKPISIWGRFSPSTLVSPANLQSIKFSILTITLSSYNRPEVANVPSGPSLDSTPHNVN